VVDPGHDRLRHEDGSDEVFGEGGNVLVVFKDRLTAEA
jgi:hypothetical protein